MAIPVDPPDGVGSRGKHYYSMWQTLFEIDTKYVPIKPIGIGAYGIVCSSIHRETNEKVAIKKGKFQGCLLGLCAYGYRFASDN